MSIGGEMPIFCVCVCGGGGGGGGGGGAGTLGICKNTFTLLPHLTVQMYLLLVYINE